ncbi:MAG: enoyl-CoA hydratase/isomerase family protein [Actinobacteria bacterium]|nr:enoyl-CoA hydratase/isomerase family protein [Actinomycetota bacterium]
MDVSDGVAVVTIDNPPVNLFDLSLYPAMVRVSDELASDDGVRAVVLASANPDFFIAHFDVSLILSLPRDMGTPGTLTDFDRMCENFRTMPKPTIAAIDGRVGGGGSELTLACDMRFASPRAVFNQPEVALGILPGGGGTVRLPRLIGRNRAMEVVLGSEDIDAATAESWGWVNRVVADPLAHSVALARRIASFPPNAVREAKASVLRNDTGVEDALLAESGGFNRLLGDPRARTAMENFLARGGQTKEGELRLGELAVELGD